MSVSFVSVGAGKVRCVESGCVIPDTAFARMEHESAYEVRRAKMQAAPVPVTEVVAEQSAVLQAAAKEIAKLRAELAAKPEQ